MRKLDFFVSGSFCAEFAHNMHVPYKCSLGRTPCFLGRKISNSPKLREVPMQIPIFKPPHVLFGFSSSSDRKTSINQWQSTCNGTVPESLGLLVCTSPRWSLITCPRQTKFVCSFVRINLKFGVITPVLGDDKRANLHCSSCVPALLLFCSFAQNSLDGLRGSVLWQNWVNLPTKVR